MSTDFLVRDALASDAAALLEIYRPYVETTAISFEVVAPTVDEFRERILTALAQWSWVVAARNGVPVGYAYGTTHRAREAYAKSVEVSAYVEADSHRGGIAGALYSSLFSQLVDRNYESAFAGITLPNPASVGFHQHFGFQPIGVFPKVGYKFGKWHDVAWMYRPIQSDGSIGKV